MAAEYILAVDQGTTSSRAVVFDKAGRVCGMAQKEFEQIYPQPGWVEHNPMEILETEIFAMRRAVREAGLSSTDIAAIGITNQRETTIAWDARTGRPVYNAIVWQCRRTAEVCEQLADTEQAKMIHQVTGLVIDPYFAGTKMQWILENVPEAAELAEQGHLRFGTVDTWLIWHFTGGKRYVTDVSNASRTMLFNIHTLQWDEELLHFSVSRIRRCPKFARRAAFWVKQIPVFWAMRCPSRVSPGISTPRCSGSAASRRVWRRIRMAQAVLC